MKNILCLSPHTDDMELGCGATISKLIKKNNRVKSVVFSNATKSLPKHFGESTLINECSKAHKILKIKDLVFFDYPVREFNVYRQNILEVLYELNKSYKPDIVFTPCSNDVHQDHSVIYSESLRAFKKTSIIGYELQWNIYNSNASYYIEVDKKDVELKMKSLNCYKSQSAREYFNDKYQYSLLAQNGRNINASYAEKFEIIKLVDR